MLHGSIPTLVQGVIQCLYGFESCHDPVTNSLTKFGNLKVDDIILRRVNEDGCPCGEYSLLEGRWTGIRLV
jgi:hypothetical protein